MGINAGRGGMRMGGGQAVPTHPSGRAFLPLARRDVSYGLVVVRRQRWPWTRIYHCSIIASFTGEDGVYRFPRWAAKDPAALPRLGKRR